MTKFYLLFLLAAGICCTSVHAQNLPHWMTEDERALLPYYLQQHDDLRDIQIPDFVPRASAEWEEIQALMITWTTYTSILKPIVDAAQEECLVYIVCTDSNSVKNSLASSGIPLTNVKFVIKGYLLNHRRQLHRQGSIHWYGHCIILLKKIQRV